MVEILIAMFVFLIGGLGVLSLFPVAMNNAGRVLGETRANILAQSVVAQLTADCRVSYETWKAASGSATTLVRAPLPGSGLPTSYFTTQGYFVTVKDLAAGVTQSRFIIGYSQSPTGSANDTIIVSPPWTTFGSWSQPAANDQYVITKMGLPDPPYITTPTTVPPASGYGTFGLNRDLAVRSFATTTGNFAAPNGLVSGSAPNGFFAGIANWHSSPPAADAFVSYTGTATNSASDASDLVDTANTWAGLSPFQYVGYQVRIVSGTGAGQVRTIIGNDVTNDPTHRLLLSSSWTTVPIGATYEIGWVNDLAWCAKLRTDATVWNPGSGTDINHIVRGANPSAWPVTPLTGKYVYITSGPGAGQARAIKSYDFGGSNVYVTPPFTTAPDTTSTYELMESRGYVLITSGRAANRLFPVVWDQRDQNRREGNLIVCAGTDFTVLNGITQSSPTYNLQNATTFTVIGNQSPLGWPSTGIATMPMILNAIPDGSTIGSWTTSPNPPSWFNTLNTVGYLNAAGQPGRLALDQFNVLTQGGGSYTSDYSYGVVFSDSGTDVSLPVRVDVFVWRNFDITKDFAQNQKPVGHMSGYIKRP